MTIKSILRRVLLTVGLIPASLFAEEIKPIENAPYAGQVYLTGSYGTFGNSYFLKQTYSTL